MIPVLLVLIQLEQQLQQVLAVLVLVVQAFRHLNGFLVLPLTDVRLHQRFRVDGVVRVERCRFLHHLHGLVVVLQHLVVLRQEVVGLGGLRVNLRAALQQVEGRVAVALLALHHRLQETLGVGEMRGER